MSSDDVQEQERAVVAAADACYLQLLDVAQRIHSGEMSAVELTEAQLERIERVDSELGSFTVVTVDLALEQAQRADEEIGRGEIRGPLHVVPIAVKDVVDTKGVPTAGGMAIHKERRPDADATVVRRLVDAGSVLLGKLVLTQGAYAEHREPFVAPMNPWNDRYWSGASSAAAASRSLRDSASARWDQTPGARSGFHRQSTA